MVIGAVLASALTLAGLRPLGLFNGLWGLLLNLAICVGGSLLSPPGTAEQNRARELTHA